jgi:hypothetical protein
MDLFDLGFDLLTYFLSVLLIVKCLKMTAGKFKMVLKFKMAVKKILMFKICKIEFFCEIRFGLIKFGYLVIIL